MKKIMPFVIVLLAVAGGMFYAGVNYTKAKGVRSFGNFQNFTPEQMQEMRAGAGGTAGTRAGRDGAGGFASGEIISKDDKSVTIKLSGGGSKIIFFSDATKITKSVNGTSDDLKVGESITAGGDSNSDGSVTAKTIQLRAALSAPVPVAK